MRSAPSIITRTGAARQRSAFIADYRDMQTNQFNHNGVFHNEQRGQARARVSSWKTTAEVTNG